jgi:hypothetical protein
MCLWLCWLYLACLGLLACASCGIWGAVQGTRHRGHCCFMVVAFFPVEERGEIFDGVFGSALVTLWCALVMCWFGLSTMVVVDVDEDGMDGWTLACTLWKWEDAMQSCVATT